MSDNQAFEKIFAGARLRRLRRERGMTQAEAAEALGLSASYLNLLERNQRPVTARVLLALAEAFDVDVRSFANESDRQLIADSPRRLPTRSWPVSSSTAWNSTSWPTASRAPPRP